MRVKHVWLNGNLAVGHRISIDVVIVNVGEAPGHIVEFQVATKILRTDEMLAARPAFPNVPIAQDRAIHAGMAVHFADLPTELHVTEAQRTSIVQKKMCLHCYGAAAYIDAGGRRRKTAFCRVLNVPVEPNGPDDLGRFVQELDADYEYEE